MQYPNAMPPYNTHTYKYKTDTLALYLHTPFASNFFGRAHAVFPVAGATVPVSVPAMHTGSIFPVVAFFFSTGIILPDFACFVICGCFPAGQLRASAPVAAGVVAAPPTGAFAAPPTGGFCCRQWTAAASFCNHCQLFGLRLCLCW